MGVINRSRFVEDYRGRIESRGNEPYQGHWVKLKVSGVGVAAGDCGSLLNPLGRRLLITRAILDITTQSTGASTVDIGVAADATTLNDTLIDGLSGATAGTFDNIENQGTNGDSCIPWGATSYITVSEASGDVTGLVGDLYVHVIDPGVA